MKEVYKTVKGVTYFPSYHVAVGYAISNGLPTDRVIAYDLGYAIQERVSGPYWNHDLNCFK